MPRRYASSQDHKSSKQESNREMTEVKWSPAVRRGQVWKVGLGVVSVKARKSWGGLRRKKEEKASLTAPAWKTKVETAAHRRRSKERFDQKRRMLYKSQASRIDDDGK
jgi:hypothetical protein